jgi:hypothetical protein
MQVFENPLNANGLEEIDGVRTSLANGLEDLAAKRWMSCLVVSNGFRFQADHGRPHDC